MDEARTLNKVKSADGTTIAFECLGQGPALILVSGATADRQATFPLAALLAPHFTAVAYDRRGRGDSGDARPYSVEREIEDIQALMNETGGGKAFVFGHSSGAALTIEAALQGLPFPKMALYEPPYVINDSRPPFPDDYVPTLESLLAEDRRGDAIEYFWRVGLLMPPETIAGMKAQPWWPGLEALAPTLPYDGLACRDHLQGKPLPLDWGTRLTMPVLVLDGGDSPASLRDPVAALAGLLPHVERHTFEGQGHGAPVEMVAPVLERFFRS